MEPLRVQSEKAEKFLVLAQERKKLEISVWVHRIGELRSKLDDLENALLINKNETRIFRTILNGKKLK